MSDDSVDSLIRQLDRLRLQEARVLQRLIEARQRENNSGENQPDRAAFRIGGRVTVNNPNARFGRTIGTNDRRAIITKITDTRVYYTTLSGASTWRARSNLTIVDPEVTWSDNE